MRSIRDCGPVLVSLAGVVRAGFAISPADLAEFFCHTIEGGVGTFRLAPSCAALTRGSVCIMWQKHVNGIAG